MKNTTSPKAWLSWVLAAALFGGAASAADLQRYVDPMFDVAVTADIQYGEARLEDYHRRPSGVEGEHQPLLLDLYEPIGDAAQARPVFIFAHGGSLVGGDKAQGSGNPVYMATQMASRGYLAASVNYRLLDQFIEGPSFIGALNPNLPEGLRDAQHDVQAAVRWFRANADALRVDADRIVVSGHSAGAGVALLVNYNADDPGESGNPGHPAEVAAVISHAGSLLEPSPIGMNEPPALDIHAIDDTTVPLAFTLVNTYVPARALGNVFELTLFTSGGHGMSGHLAERVGGTVSFLCRFVVDCA